MDRERDKQSELSEYGKVGMDRINKLVKGIMSISYRVRHQRIMEFVVECLEDEILKMEEEGMVNKEDQKKYEDLKVAIELLDEHNDVMKYIMNVAKHKEEEEFKVEIKANKEMDTSSDDDEDDEDDDDDDDDTMDIDFFGAGQKGKNGNQ
jgi:hypothetical protein